MMKQEEIVQGFNIPLTQTTVVPINAAGPGPFYVYSPGLTFNGLQQMVYFFNSIPGGRVFRIKSDLHYVNKGQLPEGAASVERTTRDFFGTVKDVHHGREIPAQDTLNALLSDRSLTELGLVQVTPWDKIDIEEGVFNSFINPESVADSEEPVDNHLRTIRKQDGMLRVREIWLEEALEALETGRMLEDYRRIIEARPLLLDEWKSAIKKVLLPAINTFRTIANVQLAEVEEAMRSGAIRRYDPFANNLMWLLGRKPERTALSRTLEAAEKGASGGGLSDESAKVLAQAIQTVKPAVAPALETVQCPRCGNHCETIMGGPPQICWRCQYSFSAALETVDPGPVIESEPEVTIPIEEPVSPISDEISNLADSILKKNSRK